MRRHLPTFVVAFTLLAAGALAAHAGEQPQRMEKRIIVVKGHDGDGPARALPDASQIPGDHLRIEDLSDLGVGDSRTYWTETGREVTVTRKDETRYGIAVAGKQLEIGGELANLESLEGLGAGEEKRIIVRREHHGDKATSEVEEEVGIPQPLTATSENAVVIEIVDQADDKQMHRLLVVDVAEPQAE